MLAYLRFVADGNFGEVFSLGQVILEIFLLPVAVWGLWMAVEEFRNSQRRPGLYLIWGGEENAQSKELSLQLSKKEIDINSSNTPKHIAQSIVLQNEGNNVATWFSVHMEFPVELLGKGAPHFWSTDLIRLLGFKNEYGGGDHWDLSRGPSAEDVVLQSNGTLASYPQQRVILGTLWFIPVPEGKSEVQRYRIKYKIFTDVGPSRVDWLDLKVHWTG